MTRYLLVLLPLISLAPFLWPAQAQSLHDVHAGAGVPCTSCHADETPPTSAPPDEVCVACHGTMIETPKEGERISFPDPHRSPHLGPGEIPECTSCHNIHGQSEVTCLTCHRGFEFDVK